MKTKKNNKILNHSKLKKTRRLKTDLSIHQTGGAASCVDDGFGGWYHSKNLEKIFEHFKDENNSTNITYETLVEFCKPSDQKQKPSKKSELKDDKNKDMVFKIREFLWEKFKILSKQRLDDFKEIEAHIYYKDISEDKISEKKQKYAAGSDAENILKSLQIAIVQITRIMLINFKEDDIYRLYEGGYVNYGDGEVRIVIDPSIIDTYLNGLNYSNNIERPIENEKNYENKYIIFFSLTDSKFADVLKEFVAILYAIKIEGDNAKIRKQYNFFWDCYMSKGNKLEQGEKGVMMRVNEMVKKLLTHKPKPLVRMSDSLTQTPKPFTAFKTSAIEHDKLPNRPNIDHKMGTGGKNVTQITIYLDDVNTIKLKLNDCIKFYRKDSLNRTPIMAKIVRFDYNHEGKSVNSIVYLPWLNKENDWDDQEWSINLIYLENDVDDDSQHQEEWETITKLESCPNEPQFQAIQNTSSQQFGHIRGPIPPKSTATTIRHVDSQLLQPALTKIHSRNEPLVDTVFRDINSDLQKITQQLRSKSKDPILEYRKSLLELIAYELEHLYLYYHDSIFRQYKLQIKTQIVKWKKIYSSIKQ